MRTFQALAVMAMWSIAMVSILNFIGFNDHYREPLWALGGAVILIITLIGNFWLFLQLLKKNHGIGSRVKVEMTSKFIY